MESPSEEIQRACRLGDLALLQHSLSQHPSLIDEKDGKLGWTGLYRSVICGHYETSEFLLKSKADPNIKTKMGDTALHQAADNKQYKIALLLIGYSADPDLQQNDGETALHLSSFKGDTEMVRLLLEQKANPNIQNFTFGKTPLHYAVDYSYIEIINLLIQYNADVDIKDKHGKSAKDIARTSEIQQILLQGSNEISYELEKPSIGAFSSILSRSNSEISVYSDCKSVEFQVKQLENIHKKIRETVRASVDTVKHCASHEISTFFEPDAEKTVYDIVVDKNKIISFGGTERNPELYNFLSQNRLDELYGLLICAGYDDLSQLIYQMYSPVPITEDSLREIGVKKQGQRKRLLLALENLQRKENLPRSPAKVRYFNCCTVSTPSNLWVSSVPGLSQWLETLSLKELHSVFLQHGYDDLEDMINIMNSAWEITNDDLKEIGIEKVGYRHRVLSKLKEDASGFPGGNRKKEVIFDKTANSVACESCVIS